MSPFFRFLLLRLLSVPVTLLIVTFALMAALSVIPKPGGSSLTYWWVFLPATIIIVLFGVGWNLLGDGLNYWLNPQHS
jgi:hypothetical protein